MDSVTSTTSFAPAALRTRLLQDHSAQQQLLESLPAEHEQRRRCAQIEIDIMRQQRARNPDTLLSGTLWVSHDKAVVRFENEPQELERCIATHEASTPLTAEQLHAHSTDFRSYLLEYRTIRRLADAQLVASSLFLESGAVHFAVSTAENGRDLLTLLQAKAPRQRRSTNEDLPDTELVRAPSARYQPFPAPDAQGVQLFATAEGGLLGLWPDRRRFAVDVSLVTEDSAYFPDPQQPAATERCPIGLPKFLYTDRGGRRRELVFRSVTERFSFPP
jgi:hypothetical protein